MSWTVATDVAERIRQLRGLLGTGPEDPLTQSDLGRRAGVRASQVSQWERGAQRPSRSRLERWAEREGWPVEIFAEGGPEPVEVLRGLAASPSPAAETRAPEGANPEEILARFYRLMAEAAEAGRPFPPELARLMDALYGAATDRRRSVPGW